MSQPRYQIFVSSTFKDLEDEREAILKAILQLNQFPAGMELFPATNDDAWEHIKKVIKDSDYYVLVIGGKYGSMDETGISYTEKEYDFAVSHSIPVLAFIRSDEENIPVGKVEMDKEPREKLKKFKKKVSEKHHLNFWTSPETLKEKVLSSLAMAFATNPQIGWVKAKGIDNNELLSRLAVLQKRFDSLAEENKELREKSISFDSTQFVFGENKIEISCTYGKSFTWLHKLSWNNLFFSISKSCIVGCKEVDLKRVLKNVIFAYFEVSSEYEKLKKEHNKDTLLNNIFRVSDESFNIIRNQLLALELIEIRSTTTEQSHPFNQGIYTNILRIWFLTEKGRKLYLNKFALKNLS